MISPHRRKACPVQYVGLCFPGAPPFFATSSCDPKIGFELDIRVENSDEVQAHELATWMAGIHDFLRSHIRYAQAKYIGNADAHRFSARVFQPGDMTFLEMRNMRTMRPLRKLGDKNSAPPPGSLRIVV